MENMLKDIAFCHLQENLEINIVYRYRNAYVQFN